MGKKRMRYTLLIPSIIFLNRQEFSLSRQVLGIGFEFWFSFLFGFFLVGLLGFVCFKLCTFQMHIEDKLKYDCRLQTFL